MFRIILVLISLGGREDLVMFDVSKYRSSITSKVHEILVVCDVSKYRSALILKGNGLQKSLILLDRGNTVLRNDQNYQPRDMAPRKRTPNSLKRRCENSKPRNVRTYNH